jgi:hypothetical protein
MEYLQGYWEQQKSGDFKDYEWEFIY